MLKKVRVKQQKKNIKHNSDKNCHQVVYNRENYKNNLFLILFTFFYHFYQLL